jgi:zinc transport system substrate-binding protein
VSLRGRIAIVSALAAGAVSAAGAELTVMVSIPPQIEIVERVGNGEVTVEALIPPGRSPATYEPSPRQLATLAGADLLIPVGIPFERQVVRRVAAIAPGLTICPATGGDEQPDAAPAAAGDADDHGHGRGPDPHFWLDPMLALEHAETVCGCLCTAAPERCATFKAGLQAYRRELEEVDRVIARELAPLRGRTLLVFHPAIGHFAARYGLRQLAIEHDGKEPTGRHLGEVIEQARALDVRVIFVQPEFAGTSVRAVAEAIGARTVALDPLAPDLAANLRQIAATIVRELGPGPEGSP